MLHHLTKAEVPLKHLFIGDSKQIARADLHQQSTCNVNNSSSSKPISAFLNSSFKGPSHLEEMHPLCMSEWKMPIKMSEG